MSYVEERKLFVDNTRKGLADGSLNLCLCPQTEFEDFMFCYDIVRGRLFIIHKEEIL